MLKRRILAWGLALHISTFEMGEDLAFSNIRHFTVQCSASLALHICTFEMGEDLADTIWLALSQMYYE